jgi:PAS domain S-box-containing protein
MPSHTHAEHADVPSPDPGVVDALISQTRELRDRLDTVRLDPSVEEEANPHRRWQRALCDLAAHHLDTLGGHLDQLKEELVPDEGVAYPGEVSGEPGEGVPPGPADAPALGRAGSAEWNLVTDEVTWSDELYRIFGRTRKDGPLTLDELPSWLFAEDQQAMTTMVTACLVDGRPIDGEFRIVRPDGSVRTVHMAGEPVLDADGGAASMWAVLRDVSELRRGQRTLRETRDSLQRRRRMARTEHRLAVELREAVLPPWRGPLRFPPGGESVALDLAARYFPSATGALSGGDWYDAMQLPDGAGLLTVGELTGHGVAAASAMAVLLGALRGMAVAGMAPGPLMSALDQLLDRSAQPALGSALCCRYETATRTLTWAQAGHPAPLLFRDGTGRALAEPEGVLLGAASGAAYGQATEQLLPSDLLVLHTDGTAARRAALDGPAGAPGRGAARILGLGARFAECRSAQDCMRVVVEEFDVPDREHDACVLIARVS